MPLQEKIGACGVSLSGLPISNRDITARGYPMISGVRISLTPFAHFKRGKPGLCPGSSVAALPCKVTFQIGPLKDGLHTIAVRISDSDILGIPAAG